MNRRKLLLSLASCPICARVARAEKSAPHWTYEADKTWGDLNSDFKACGIGNEQSPIDLTGAIKAELDPLQINWRTEFPEIVNTGHTIQVNAKPGGALVMGKMEYALRQFHFHTPSEHAIDGARMAMEAHFVHENQAGRLGVVGVLMNGGGKNQAFSDIMKAAPKEEIAAPLAAKIDAMNFIPTQKAMFRYVGSLTTPPCTEVADWAVFAAPIEVDDAGINAFKKIFPMNARVMQPLRRRFLLRSM